jgi:hypothetical protein
MSNMMKIKDLLKNSWVEFKETFATFLKLAWWPILILVSIPNIRSYLEIDESTWTSVFLDFGETVAAVFLTLYSFISLFKSRKIEISLSGGKIFVFWFASIFIAFASSIATLFLVIPGLIILALSIFVPIFILYKNEGPIEAIASSSSHMQGQLLKLTCVFTVLWAVPVLFDYGLFYLSLNLVLFSIVSVVACSIVGYFIYSVAFNAYFELETTHNKSIQSSAEALAD